MLRVVLLICLGQGLAFKIHADCNSSCLPNIPEDTTASNVTKYSLYHIKLNWYQALELCFEMGKRLATFKNEAEYNQLVALIREFKGNNTFDHYWTAGSDLGERGKYVWTSTGKPVTFTKWLVNQPSLMYNGAIEQCIQLRGPTFTMNDQSCSTTIYVACETTS